jgi:hypothetical protein
VDWSYHKFQGKGFIVAKESINTPSAPYMRSVELCYLDVI